MVAYTALVVAVVLWYELTGDEGGRRQAAANAFRLEAVPRLQRRPLSSHEHRQDSHRPRSQGMATSRVSPSSPLAPPQRLTPAPQSSELVLPHLSLPAH
jgi:hypothetical protein